MGAQPWAILDFVGEDGRRNREVFRDPSAVIATDQVSEVVDALRQVEALAKRGKHLVGWVAYDAAPAFEPRFEVRSGYDGPLVWFAAFDQPVLQPPPRTAAALAEHWSSAIDPDAHRRAVEEIMEGIRRGDFYQVNYTDRFTAAIADPLNTYERIRLAQQAPYAAFIDTERLKILSVSPELFVSRRGNRLDSRPMKGTSARGRWSSEDDTLAIALASSEKERAENVMIVDLIRNDMGRIAVPGSVQVPSMFEIERYPTVLQMTSHVKSEVAPNTSLADVFTALFPCGSVTGAPKIAASKSIASLEREPRGTYCGAVGVVRPGGDFVFNVAIRTISLEPDGRAIYGAGGGITADSDPARELAELVSKAAVLTALPWSFDLFETMRLEHAQIPRLERHLRRLESSARFFGFPDPGASVEALAAELRRVTSDARRAAFRVRAVLLRDGGHNVSLEPLTDLTSPRRMALAVDRVSSSDRLLYHKTTDRSRYSAALDGLQRVDDAILLNERGEITESTIGNLVLELDGELVTPSLDCGLLPGVLREDLLESGRVIERVLFPSDLRRCTRFWMINSLRGWVDAVLVD